SIPNNATGGCFMDMTFSRIAIILEKIAKHKYAWNGGDQGGGINIGTPSLSHLMKENQEHDQMLATMDTNIAILTKKLTESEAKKMHAINETTNGVPYDH
ncbi:hypothetical protein HAX54_018011, partial [Datura stramonium]|nr:hypothetical protein [Datura stramonium]